MSIDKEIVFEQDTAERKRWFVAASFSHPAKMHLSLQMYLIEHYTKKGDTILDPMAGSGTILVACALERNVICVELEEKFVKMQKDNWEKIKSLGPMLGYKMGEATILQSDARNLSGLLADKVIFSPPYEETAKGRVGGICTRDESMPQLEYSHNKENIGNLKSESYLEAMLAVYQECYKVLRDKGLMVLVVKNFIRNKEIVRLDLDTIKLCEQANFHLIEQLKRKLTQQSFWRRIAQLKCDHRKGKRKCKLGLKCPVVLTEKDQLFLDLFEGKVNTEEGKQICEKRCPKFINTMPTIDFEDILVFRAERAV